MVERISAALLLNAPGARTGRGDGGDVDGADDADDADDADEDADEDTLAKAPLTPPGGATFDGDGDDDEDADEGSLAAPFLLTPPGGAAEGDDDEDNRAKAPRPSPLTRVAAERGTGRGDGGFVCEDDVDDHGDEDAVAATAMDFFDFAR